MTNKDALVEVIAKATRRVTENEWTEPELFDAIAQAVRERFPFLMWPCSFYEEPDVRFQNESYVAFPEHTFGCCERHEGRCHFCGQERETE